jgi:hypothetical protein
MVELGFAKDILDIGIALTKHVKKVKDDSNARDLVTALRVIYFDKSLVDLLQTLRVADSRDRREAARKIKLRLIDGRYNVDKSLKLVEAELTKEISIKKRRMFESVTFSKTTIRNEIFRALESDDYELVIGILDQVNVLNDVIEEAEDRLHIKLDRQ